MIKLVWFVAFVHAQAGPGVMAIDETETFQDAAACDAYGASMKDRVADFARGVARLDWHDSLRVSFKCEPNGRPS